jgi:hypothetical protein
LAEEGQGIVEYILVLAVIFSIFMIVAKPGLKRLQDKIADGMKSGIFAENSDDSGFYYFPMK